MLPATVREGTSSPAEHAMFAHIRDELSDDWIVLHSLGLTIHHAKPWAEIDFVLIGPPGVICLEVKGGLVSRQDGIWYTTPQRGGHAGQPRRLHESPFEQVGSASAQLFKFIRAGLPRSGQGDHGLCGCRARRASGRSGDPISTWPWCMTSVTARGHSLISWIASSGAGTSVLAGWAGHLEALGRREKQAVLESIRGDFHLVPSLRAQRRRLPTGSSCG